MIHLAQYGKIYLAIHPFFLRVGRKVNFAVRNIA